VSGVHTATPTSSRVFWLEYVTYVAHGTGVAPFFWDKGEEFNRYTYQWSARGLLDALLRATSGETYTVTPP